MVARSVAEAVERLGLRGRTLVVACSGGIDSTVLADALHQAGLDLRLGHVNHGLRGAEADADAEFVRAFAEARARKALVHESRQLGRVLHPSPASPAANRGWAERATVELRALTVALP